MISIEKRAESVEEAKSQGLLQLGMEESQVDVEIVSEGGDGELAIVRLTTKWTEEDGVLDYVCGLLDRMDLDCSLDVEPTSSGYKVIISGEDSNYAIGHRGEVLDAIQYLAQITLNRDKETYTKVTVDAENYRVRREDTLRDLAKRLAEKAVRNRARVELEPMNPHERKIVHETLADNDDVVTFSTGNEPNRFVTIEPKAPEKVYGTQSSFRKHGIKTKSYGVKRRGF
ncbi:MAG: protein jag [Clostridia bacterium]|nr:protein jag [Clostridia bacterium]